MKKCFYLVVVGGLVLNLMGCQISNKVEVEKKDNAVEEVTEEKKGTNDNLATGLLDSTDWQNYTNSRDGYTLKYPQSWRLVADIDESDKYMEYMLNQRFWKGKPENKFEVSPTFESKSEKNDQWESKISIEVINKDNFTTDWKDIDFNLMEVASRKAAFFGIEVPWRKSFIGCGNENGPDDISNPELLNWNKRMYFNVGNRPSYLISFVCHPYSFTKENVSPVPDIFLGRKIIFVQTKEDTILSINILTIGNIDTVTTQLGLFNNFAASISFSKT